MHSCENDITTVYANNGAFGYWKTTDITPFSPFSTTLANSIDNDSVYVNAHSAANAGGEIRGQLSTGFKCYSIATGIKVQGISESEVLVYPNPTRNSFNVAIVSGSNEKTTINVYDVVGKLVVSTTNDVQIGHNNLFVDLKNSPSGMYFVKISNSKYEFTKKLIVE